MSGVYTIVSCCYCLAPQEANRPPALHVCTKCRRPFRVVEDCRKGEVSHIGLSDEARKFYTDVRPSEFV